VTGSRGLQGKLKVLIGRYQGRLLEEAGALRGSWTAKGLAEKGDGSMRAEMIQSAGATAMKGLGYLAAAEKLKSSENPEERSAGDRSWTSADQTIRHAAKTIGQTILVLEAEFKADQAAIDAAFDVVWGAVPAIPGLSVLGGVAWNAAKGSLTAPLKAGFRSMMSGMSVQNIEQIKETYRKTATDLADAQILSGPAATMAQNTFGSEFAVAARPPVS
jgi:hypothetical protein